MTKKPFLQKHCQGQPQEQTQEETQGQLQEESQEESHKKLKKTQEKLLRALAENENVRKQARREIQETAQYAITAFARDMLPILDSLQRALQENDSKILKEGVKTTLRALQNTFAYHKIERMTVLGQPFDARYHEAFFGVPPTPKNPAGTVAVVVEEGYKIGDRLLRPARVGVAQEEKKEEPKKEKS